MLTTHNTQHTPYNTCMHTTYTRHVRTTHNTHVCTLPQEPAVVEQLDQSLNRVSFTPSGQYVAVGDEVGKIFVYELGEELHTPHPDEWTRLQQLLMEFPEQPQMDNVANKQEPIN